MVELHKGCYMLDNVVCWPQQVASSVQMYCGNGGRGEGEGEGEERREGRGGEGEGGKRGRGGGREEEERGREGRGEGREGRGERGGREEEKRGREGRGEEGERGGREETPWPSPVDGRLFCAVNSFGLSGTNAHVVLEGYASSENGASSGDGTGPSGARRSVNVSLQAPFAGVVLPEDMAPERTVRVLPLSGKTPKALRASADEYLAWLEEQAEGLSPEQESAWLADVAWTAGTGRSHFGYRAGLAFRDAAELAAGLRTVAESEDKSDDELPRTAAKIAFVYASTASQWQNAASGLYRTEPVVRAALDRCNQVLREERGMSLLEAVLDDRPIEGSGDPAMERAATFAVQAAVTALWQSVGVRPSAVLGEGVGELAAALAAGVLSMEDGLRLAVAFSGPDAALPQIAANPPTMTMVSSVTSRVVQQSDTLDNAHWRKLTGEAAAFETCLETLAGTGVDLVLELGRLANHDSTAELWPQTGEGAHPLAFIDGMTDFPHAFAQAYEAGAPGSFVGLFAGESRRRVSLPSYPFQRRSLWVQSR